MFSKSGCLKLRRTVQICVHSCIYIHFICSCIYVFFTVSVNWAFISSESLPIRNLNSSMAVTINWLISRKCINNYFDNRLTVQVIKNKIAKHLFKHRKCEDFLCFISLWIKYFCIFDCSTKRIQKIIIICSHSLHCSPAFSRVKHWLLICVILTQSFCAGLT